jgi:hydroxymethylglutaryl-CoA lyase
MTKELQLVECPRDAMQGWKNLIPSDRKVSYLNSLLRVGFHSLDFGSFVSARAIPQMADTRDVVGRIHWKDSRTKLLAIIANLRGAEEAVSFEGVHYLGFPFSVSPTFQQKNTNAGIEASFDRLRQIQDCCRMHGRELVVYLSMAFGNPYGDPYAKEEVLRMAGQCSSLGVGIISLADTVGLASPEQVYDLTRMLVEAMPETTIGVHLHSTPDHWKEKVGAAWEAGCRRFDGALGGYGGCPMAGNELVGNMNTEWLISFLEEKQALPALDLQALNESRSLALEVFSE